MEQPLRIGADSMITNHVFAQGNDGRCVFTYGRGSDREWCGQTKDRHANSPIEVARLGGGLAQHRPRSTSGQVDALVDIAKRFRDGYDIDHQPDGRWVWYIPGISNYRNIEVETRPDVLAVLREHFDGSSTPGTTDG